MIRNRVRASRFALFFLALACIPAARARAGGRPSREPRFEDPSSRERRLEDPSTRGPRSEAPPSRALLLELTAEPRLAGTCGSLFGAQVVARVLEKAGWKVEIDEREVLLSLPRAIELAIYDGPGVDRPLVERIDRFDPDAIPPGDVPKCNGWSASGKVRASVVDAGRGLRADFERLKKIGVDARGTIALLRYGGSYRGVKVDLATEYGCSGVLLYDDPASDGPDKGPTWPEGPWKPDWEAQRGSISPMGKVPGDPTTPGWPSPKPGERDARRISGQELDDALPRIPCIPIGSRDAKAIQERLAPVKTTDKDGKEIEERLGPGPAQVRLLVDMPRDLRTIRNVIARLPGESDRVVVAGAHRDSWVRGANDDGAGTVATLRAAQLLGEKARAGWKPKSTIVLGFWDAEEFGLIGSTEWGEANEGWLRERCLAYVNADTGVNGAHFRGASGTPGMLGTLKTVLERIPAVPDEKGQAAPNLWEEWRAALQARQKDPSAEPRLGLPGSGSDFAVFLHHLDLPTIEFGFGGSGGGGAYHTTFDDFTFVEKHVDPGFVGHELAGRFLAELLVEISDLGTKSFDRNEAVLEIVRHADECAKAATTASVDEPLGKAFAALSAKLLAHFDSGIGEWTWPDPFYQTFEASNGLPGRPWFRNRLWAPEAENGYGAELFPTLRLAARQGEDALKAELDSFFRSIDLLKPQSGSPR